MPLHILIAHLVAATTPTTTKSGTSKGSGSYVPLLVLLVLFALGYFFFLRPRSQRMRQQQAAQRQIAIGDEVMSAGGIYGRVVALDADEVEVEVSPGVVLTFTRRAISLRQGTAGTGSRPAGGQAAPADPIDEPWDVPGSRGDGPGDQAAADDIPPVPPFAGGGPPHPEPGTGGGEGAGPAGGSWGGEGDSGPHSSGA